MVGETAASRKAQRDAAVSPGTRELLARYGLRPGEIPTEAVELRPALVSPATWRDPDDTAAMERDERGRAHQKTIAGFRVVDPLTRLPCAPEHIKAATKLRIDWERGSGARTGSSDAGKVDNSVRDHDSVAAGMEARRRYQDAFDAVGIIGCSWLLPVVLCGWTVADLVKKRGGNAMTVQGRVMAALDRLAEHFGLGESRATVVLEAPWMLTPYVPVDQALPAERIGRGRR